MAEAQHMIREAEWNALKSAPCAVGRLSGGVHQLGRGKPYTNGRFREHGGETRQGAGETSRPGASPTRKNVRTGEAAATAEATANRFTRRGPRGNGKDACFSATFCG